MTKMRTITATLVALVLLASCDVRHTTVTAEPGVPRQVTHCPAVTGGATVGVTSASRSAFNVRVFQLADGGRVFLGALSYVGDVVVLGRIRGGSCMALVLVNKGSRSVTLGLDLTSGDPNGEMNGTAS